VGGGGGGGGGWGAMFPKKHIINTTLYIKTFRNDVLPCLPKNPCTPQCKGYLASQSSSSAEHFNQHFSILCFD
jgi:hypothetical protein